MTQDMAGARITPKLINSLYVEAMVLADEARAYFDRHGREQRLQLDPIVRVGFSVESLKVTTRLMHVIAWLLTQRAVEAGELSVVDAGAPPRRLGEPPASDPALLVGMPEAAAHLVRASQDLFARVARLEMSQHDPSPQASPARSLLSRLERSL